MLLDLPRDVILSVARFRLCVHTLRFETATWNPLFATCVRLMMPGWKTCSLSLHAPSDGFSPQTRSYFHRQDHRMCLLYYTRKTRKPIFFFINFMNRRAVILLDWRPLTLYQGKEGYALCQLWEFTSKAGGGGAVCFYTSMLLWYAWGVWNGTPTVQLVRTPLWLYNSLTNKSNSYTMKKVLHADMQLSTRSNDCWSAHVLPAMDGLTQSYIFNQKLQSCEPIDFSRFA